jgi:ferric-dicitrate binding protein FerR (iron transport regulator)
MNEYQKILKNWELPEGKSTEQAWSELEPKLPQTAKRPAKVVSLNWKPLAATAAAAAAVIIAIVFAWPGDTLLKQQTTAMETKQVVLPDNSVVTLNANSSIEYAADWSHERTLQLNGEAFFDVEKGSTFKVVTEKGIVTVLGTSFDVFARNEKFRVTCTTGKVAVTAGKSSVEITPGNTVELTNDVLLAGTFNSRAGNWMIGEFNYSAEPLENVVLELQRQFGITIKTPDLSGRIYSGYFNNKNLNEALELVFTPMKLSYKIENDGIVVVEEAK